MIVGRRIVDTITEKFLADLLRAERRFVKHLNDYAVGICAIERCAAVSMHFEWMNNLHSARAEFRFKFLDPLDAFDDETQMVKLSLLGGLEEIFRHFMDRDVVAPGRKINVPWIRLPNYVHAENVLIEFYRPRDAAHLKRDMAHASNPGDSPHAGTIA